MALEGALNSFDFVARRSKGSLVGLRSFRQPKRLAKRIISASLRRKISE